MSTIPESDGDGLSSALAITGNTLGRAGNPPRLVRLWSDAVRVEQRLRLQSLELQHGEWGERAFAMASEQWRQLPAGVRIDLPSPRVFSAVLGLFRTGATLKQGKLLRLELSAEDIGALLGYGKATIEAALRWLGCETIEYQGMQVSRGLGLVHRGRRTAWARLEGTLRRVYRTSRLILTGMGRMLLGLPAREEERQTWRRAPPLRAPKTTGRAWHLPKAANSDPPPLPKPPEVAPDSDLGRAWLKNIQELLK